MNVYIFKIWFFCCLVGRSSLIRETKNVYLTEKMLIHRISTQLIKNTLGEFGLFSICKQQQQKRRNVFRTKKKSLMNQLDVLELFFYLFHIYIIHCEWIRATYSPSIFYSIWKNSPCVLICFSQTTINWSESFSSPRVRFLSINLYSDSSSSFSRLISN